MSQDARLHLDTLSPATLAALASLGPRAAEKGFYLAGGTGLALQLGHRRSVDLDWFTQAAFDPLVLARELQESGLALAVRGTSRGTLHAALGEVRASFLSYRYPLLEPAVAAPELGCEIASLSDLAAMKLAAIAQRGLKRDFYDVVALGSSGLDLGSMLALYQKKYSVRDVGHVLAGLAYFDDAERDRDPVLQAREDWASVQRKIRGWVREFAG